MSTRVLDTGLVARGSGLHVRIVRYWPLGAANPRNRSKSAPSLASKRCFFRAVVALGAEA